MNTQYIICCSAKKKTLNRRLHTQFRKIWTVYCMSLFFFSLSLSVVCTPLKLDLTKKIECKICFIYIYITHIIYNIYNIKIKGCLTRVSSKEKDDENLVFHLFNDMLSYATFSGKKYHIEGVFAINENTLVKKMPPKFREHCFTVSHKDREDKLVLRATSDRLRDLWITKIQSCVNEVQKKTHTHYTLHYAHTKTKRIRWKKTLF